MPAAAAQSGADVNVASLRGRSPLHTALLHGHRRAAARLLGARADANVRDAGGCLPLHYAAMGLAMGECARSGAGSAGQGDGDSTSTGGEGGDASLVELLLEEGAGRPVRAGRHADPRKGLAGRAKLAASLDAVLSAGLADALCPRPIAEPASSERELLLLADAGGLQPLHYAAGAAGAAIAAGSGDGGRGRGLVEQLLRQVVAPSADAGVEVEAGDWGSAIARQSRTAAVRVLLARGAAVDGGGGGSGGGCDGPTPLHFAVSAHGDAGAECTAALLKVRRSTHPDCRLAVRRGALSGGRASAFDLSTAAVMNHLFVLAFFSPRMKFP